MNYNTDSFNFIMKLPKLQIETLNINLIEQKLKNCNIKTREEVFITIIHYILWYIS